MDTITMSDFYDSINDLLSYVGDLEDAENMIDNIELGHLEETTTGLKMDESIRQYALSYYKQHQAQKIRAILNICNELGTYTNVTKDEKCHRLDWTVNRK